MSATFKLGMQYLFGLPKNSQTYKIVNQINQSYFHLLQKPTKLIDMIFLNDRPNNEYMHKIFKVKTGLHDKQNMIQLKIVLLDLNPYPKST